MKDGHALCIRCGGEPEKRDVPKQKPVQDGESNLVKALERKLESLSTELEQETVHEKQQEILKSISSIA